MQVINLSWEYFFIFYLFSQHTIEDLLSLCQHSIKVYSAFFFIVFWLLCAEIGLNTLRYVAKDGSFDLEAIHFILTGRATQQPEGNVNISPISKTTHFPFNSLPITQADFQSLRHRIWFSSASHAADQHGVEKQFPNLLCEFMALKDCYVLNASRPGIVINDNTSDVQTHMANWSPNIAVLYQSYLDIHQMRNDAFSLAPKKPSRATTAKLVLDALGAEKTFKNITLRTYSRNYIGSAFLLSTPLESSLPEGAKQAFLRKFNRFIDVVKAQGVKPVLTTFVSVHGRSQSEIQWEDKSWLMRYFENISPE